MTEQERPRTEAGRWLDEIAPELWRQPSNRAMPMDPMQLEIRKAVLAIEEAARTEGRQQAVREAKQLITTMADIPFEPGRYVDGWRGAVKDALYWLDRVAGLNASESPPPEYGWHNDGDECIGPHCINMEHDDERDASESGQPPETGRTYGG